MLIIEEARLSDRTQIEALIAEYHISENLVPVAARISWAVDLQMKGTSPGILLVAREENSLVGVALAVLTPSAELGQVLTVNDFFVKPDQRRRGVGRQLVERLVEESRKMGVNVVYLEVLRDNKVASRFWRSMGFKLSGRHLFTRTLG